MTEDLQTSKRGIARIYNTKNQIIGSGFLVSPRYLLTCAHVIKEALNLEDTKAIPQNPVKFDLPSHPNLSGKVVHWQPYSSIERANYGEDIAVLEVVGELSLNFELAGLYSRSAKWGQEVHLFGFPEDYDNGIWAMSVLRDFIFNGWLQMDQIKLSDRIIEGGFSGAPVWDKERTTVIGMATASDLGSQDQTATAFAIPSSVLINTCLKFLHLLDILSSWDLSLFQIINKAYIECRQKDFEKTIPQTIEGMIKNFADEAKFNLEKNKQSLDVDVFVLSLLSEPKIADSTNCKLLTEWANNYIDDFENVLEQKREKSRNLISLSKYQEPLTYLMLRFQKNKQFKDTYAISAVFIPDKNQYNVSENKGIVPLEIRQPDPEKERFTWTEVCQILPTILNNLLNEGKKYKPRTEPEIIFFLPYALFDKPLETFILQNEDEDEDEDEKPLPVPLRVKYRVIFRSERRLRDTYQGEYQTKWENKWKELLSCYEEKCNNYLKLDINDDTWAAIFDESDGRTIGCIISESPSPNICKAVDENGLPVAIWVKKVLDTSNYQQEFKDLLQCSIGELPKKIQQKHQQGFSQFQKQPEKSLGHNLTLLWEDPSLLPAHINYSTP